MSRTDTRISRFLSTVYILFFSYCFVIFVNLAFPKSANAATAFSTSYDVTYRVNENGNTLVTSTISLKNLVTNLYATQYEMTIKSGNIKNVYGKDAKGTLPINIEQTPDETKITASFNDVIVGKGSVLTFTLSYNATDVAKRSGRVWEIYLPKLLLDENLEHYQATMIIPESFGKPLYLKPKPDVIDGNRYSWEYNKLQQNLISAAFGDKQIFNFNLTYHLTNPSRKPVMMKIALPPDTAYQKVSYDEIKPLPVAIDEDNDGNWMATYKLSGDEQFDIVASGFAKLYISPQKERKLNESEETLKKYLKPTRYWQIKNEKIQSLANKLKTPKAIYKYVSQTLSYDYSRVTNNPKRLGAVEALKNPDRAICMEFTDLTVALLRAAGIPAREINGYAFTTNSDLRPLSLVADVLHSWTQYYDRKQKQWIPIDTTWANTTGGVDYFSSLDVNHFVFVLHGESSDYPIPAGAYKRITDGKVKNSRDVDIVVSQIEPRIKILPVSIKADVPLITGFGETNLGVVVMNPNGQALYHIPMRFSSDMFTFKPSSVVLEKLLPWSKQKTRVTMIPNSLLPFKSSQLTIFAGETILKKEIKVEVSTVLLILSVVLILIVAVFIFRKKIHFPLRLHRHENVEKKQP